jgi:hypothetical protein
LEAAAMHTWLLPGDSPASRALETSRDEYHTTVAQAGRGHGHGPPGPFLLMALLDELTADIPASSSQCRQYGNIVHSVLCVIVLGTSGNSFRTVQYRAARPVQ